MGSYAWEILICKFKDFFHINPSCIQVHNVVVVKLEKNTPSLVKVVGMQIFSESDESVVNDCNANRIKLVTCSSIIGA